MFSSFFSGISGLMANSYSISVVGNNISNVNTIGYKGARASFEDALYESIFGTAGTSQIGRGTALSSVDTLFAQGSFESTTEPTDLAIGGKGFFVVRPPEAGNLQHFYTRAGQFRFDAEGFMTNPAGYRLQGRPIDSVTGLPAAVERASVDIQVRQEGTPAQATERIGIALNLNAETAIRTDTFDPSSAVNAGATSDYSTSMTIYDSLGQSYVATVYFCKTADNEWTWHAVQGNTEATNSPGTLTFDPTTGNLSIGGGGTSIDFVLNGMTQSVNLVFDNTATTQYAAPNRPIQQSQDGYASGMLMSVTVSPEGIVEGRYDNGQIIPRFQIDLANFNNPWGLNREGGNLFAQTLDSGDPIVNEPGTSGLGKISPNSLEQSNVDLATEFVKMIIAQRGFQANSKVITTTDEMLADLMMIKR
jgi:flagellar hook protein FlgE